MNRKIKFSEGEYYHIYNRGVDKRDIFMDKYDYDRFLFLLKICNSSLPTDVREMKRNDVCEGQTFANLANTREKDLINIGAWCLMPNHFHLLVSEKIPGGISNFFQKLLTSYSMYFNKKYERSGALFQGRFQAKHANNDNYLKFLYSYIHLNPIKLIQSDWKDVGISDFEKAKDFLNVYTYSSYLDYFGLKRLENDILDKKVFPEYFESKENFKNNLFEWLNFNPEKIDIK